MSAKILDTDGTMTGEPTEPTQSPETPRTPSPAMLAGLARKSTILEDLDARAEDQPIDPSEYIPMVLRVIDERGYFRVSSIARQLRLTSHQESIVEAALAQLASEGNVVDMGYGDYMSLMRLEDEPQHRVVEATIESYLRTSPRGQTLKYIYNYIFDQEITDRDEQQRAVVLVSLHRLIQAGRVIRQEKTASNGLTVIVYHSPAFSQQA